MSHKVAVLIGSLRRESFNRRIANAIAAVKPASLEFDQIPIGDLPFYNEDLESESPPPQWTAFRNRVKSADAVLFVTPEYNRSVPGVLKNAIDWLIGSGELERKVVAITASVPTSERGRHGLAALRQTLGAVSAVIVSDEPVARGSAAEAAIRAVLGRLVDGVRRARQPPG